MEKSRWQRKKNNRKTSSLKRMFPALISARRWGQIAGKNASSGLFFRVFARIYAEAERHGPVFNLVSPQHGRPLTVDMIRPVVSDIGRRAGVVVDKAKGQHATAHDFRRAFGTRWAPRVKPIRLQLLMRHQSIETTLKYCVAEDADDVAADLWQEFGKVGTFNGNGSFSSDSADGSVDAEDRKPATINGFAAS